MGTDNGQGPCRAVRPPPGIPFHPLVARTRRPSSKPVTQGERNRTHGRHLQFRRSLGAWVSNEQRPRSQPSFPQSLSQGIPSSFSLSHYTVRFTCLLAACPLSV